MDETPVCLGARHSPAMRATYGSGQAACRAQTPGRWCDHGVAIELSTPGVDDLDDVVRALRRWQRDDAPIQLHPGDLGWSWRSGAEVLAAAVRTWSRGDTILAVGFLDGPDVLRMTVAPELWRDDELARDVVADLSDPARGVLPGGKVAVEVPDGTRVQDLLSEGVWSAGDPWTPLRLDLAAPVDRPALRTEVVGTAEQVSECVAAHRSAWGSDRFTAEGWQTMAAGSPFVDARCLLARDGQGVAVATVTIWSAGPGRPGLIEPLGVHADHRRRGYGAAICLAAAAHLQELGSSSVLVCTPSSLQSAVATYEAAGFTRLPERLDRSRAQ
jgi:ribosomal protein S18 acetylase RimI-like enzyme